MIGFYDFLIDATEYNRARDRRFMEAIAESLGPPDPWQEHIEHVVKGRLSVAVRTAHQISKALRRQKTTPEVRL